MQKIFFLLSLILFTNTYSQTSIFNSLLKKHVNNKGNVNYKAFKNEESKLQEYLNYLERTTPQKNWSPAKSKAFWINTYNAYTIKLILDNYPLKSITTIKEKGKSAWDIQFVKVGGKNHTLNHIEHEILRKKFNDPKIHVGVNCASGSCPKLGNFAFTEANYDVKTTLLLKKFINDPQKNKISHNEIQLSKIFDWFKSDFTQNGSIIDFLNKYSDTKISTTAKIKYLEYDWSLNGK